TVYVPVAGYVCDGVCAVDVVPSPKFQAYDVSVPSGSPEPTLVNEHTSALQFDCRLACGARFGATAPAGTLIARPCCFQVVPAFVPSNGAAHRWPSAHPVYNVPESMNAPRTWLQARPVVATGVATPALRPSYDLLVTVSPVACAV